MEKAQFDLSLAIVEWHRAMGATMSVSPGAIQELEIHLWETITQFKSVGLTDEESFPIATRRLGAPSSLADEFAKVRTDEWWLNRTAWMLAGVVLYQIALAMAAGTSSGFVLLGMLGGMGPAGLGYLGITGWVTFTAMAGIACRWAPLDRWLKFKDRWSPGRLFALVAASSMVIAGSLVAVPLLTEVVLTRRFGPTDLGTYWYVSAWGKTAASLCLIPILLGATAWMHRRIATRTQNLGHSSQAM